MYFPCRRYEQIGIRDCICVKALLYRLAWTEGNSRSAQLCDMGIWIDFLLHGFYAGVVTQKCVCVVVLLL